MEKIVHVGQSTVAYDHCIGCGICDAVCPHGAIDMTYTKYKEIQPVINDNCTECTTCVKYCPFTNDKIESESHKVTSSKNPNNFGVDENDGLYIAYDKRDEKRVKSASGGVVTELAIDMLNKGIVSSIIHADMQSGKIGEMHYNASVSRNAEEIESKRSSFYAPISFNEVLKEFYDKEENILIIGVPCFVRGVNEVFEKNRHYKKNKIFTIALSCGKNVNGQYIDFLAESENISKEEEFKVNLRNKDDLIDANHFKNHFFKNDFYNGEQTILKKERHETIFTTTWRNYYFSMNVCFKCSDFWGYTADVSIKDAWGKWAKDPLGKSIVVIRSNELLELFNKNDNLSKEKLDFETTTNSQLLTTQFKQVEIQNRLHKSKYHPANILNGYLLKDFISRKSKIWYSKYGYKKTSKRLKYIAKLGKLIELKDKIMNKLLRSKNPYIQYMRFYIMKFVNLFYYKKRTKSNQILVTGGYGYKNVGDEAQLNATLQLIENELPEYRKVVLTHDKDYTYNEHGKCIVFDSPRKAFYDNTDIKLYSVANPIAKVQFLITATIIYLNAYLVRAGLPTLLINAKKAALLEELKNSDLLFYSGGGYLTGKTLSRLWDGAFFIAMAKVMDVPVVLSGHTIGVWNGSFNKYLAKWGLSKANIITSRDPEESMQALKEIGIEGENSFVTFDDALFCDKVNTAEIKNELIQSGINETEFENYVTLNIHYWGIDKNIQEQQKLLARVHEIVNYLESKNYKIVLIAMTPSDYKTIDDYLEKYPSETIFKYDYQFDFRKIRAVIANSKVCVTMKHHPIIFAVGEKVPVISLALFDYYEHKNGGALKLFGLEKYNLTFDNSFDIEKFDNLFRDIEVNSSNFSSSIEKRLLELKEIKKVFIEKTKECLK
jgi:coenzyme F420 hydrogenase subunit beta